MKKHNIIVFINDGSKVILVVEYEKDYELRRDVTNIGINGILQKVENRFIYFPPHRIEKIEVEEVKI